MKWPLQLLLTAALFVAPLSAQTIVLTPSTTTLDIMGGSITFTSSLTFATTPTSIGVSISLPSNWSYTSGTNEPGVKPASGTTDVLEWAYTSMPASPAAFTFTMAYPANITGTQLLSASMIFRDGINPLVTSSAPTVSIAEPSLITWNGGTGNWTDATQWNAGIVPVKSQAHAYSAQVTAGLAAVDSAITIENLTFLGGTITGPANLTLAGLTSGWTSGTFSGAGELIIAPGAQLTASGNVAHDFNQHTIRNQGTFTWTDRGAIRSGNGGAFINSAGASFIDATIGTVDYVITNGFGGNFTFTNAGSYAKTTTTTTRVEVPFTNTGNIVVSAGTLRFTNSFTQGGGLLNVATSSTVTFDNGLNFAAGVLNGGGTIVGNVTNSAFISPGNILGTFTIQGNLTLLSTSQLSFDIGGTSPGTNYDFLSVSGAATLGGTLSLNLVNNAGTTLLPTDTFTLLNAGSLSGTFSNIADGARLMSSFGQGSFVVNYTATGLTLSGFDPIPEPSTWALLVSGLGGLAIGIWRRRVRK